MNGIRYELPPNYFGLVTRSGGATYYLAVNERYLKQVYTLLNSEKSFDRISGEEVVEARKLAWDKQKQRWLFNANAPVAEYKLNSVSGFLS